MDRDTRVEFMAIPIVAVIFGVGVVLAAASEAGAWAWLLVGAVGIVLAVLIVAGYARRHPHRSTETPAPVVVAPPDGPYRVLVIADESCVDATLPAHLAENAGGRSVEALVVAPAIGSRLSRWTGDESQFADARKHLDETVALLQAAGIEATGETGAEDPLQAADDGLREFPAHELVFVTRSGTNTDWVEQGVVESARERYRIPVTHLDTTPA